MREPDSRLVSLFDRWRELVADGQPVQPIDLCVDCPELALDLEEMARAVNQFERLMDIEESKVQPNGTPGELPPHAHGSVQAAERSGALENPEGTCTALTARPTSLSRKTPITLPVQIGRYQIKQFLGEGGFGRVYLAEDDQLRRLVAIKVPRPDRFLRVSDAEGYLIEARTLAKLDHPHIVPVYDVGQTPDGLPFVVSKFVEGCDLARRLKQSRLAFATSAELVAIVGEALHHAHRKGMVHRDIKPANILLDADGKPHIADFGLALQDEDLGKKPGLAGTPAYMSPEQTRREGHRVDGRSDVYSLGVVFYQLLTGRLPFRADKLSELLEMISTIEPRPLRQLDETIPRELERICLRALAKLASDRYQTAWDLADDLRHYLATPVGTPAATTVAAIRPPGPMPIQAEAVSDSPGVTPTAALTPAPPPSEAAVLRIVPKGLRSFDAHDADFFLELVPGPRDRNGLPDSIRFWMLRIEELDAPNTFSVGLIYGPSGCGKSSLVKAGLLPRLSHSVIAIYIEATADETEPRLLYQLRKRFPSLPTDLGLAATLTELRRGAELPVGKKVLIVLDQFEQWLHAVQELKNTELVQALRQCDGGCVQCLVLVRDDFWMATTRFLREVEIDLVLGKNCAAVDLFDLRHATRVLKAYGRAFGTLPDRSAQLDREQTAFVQQAVSGLAQDGKVVSVRLALFAEMMKSKTWIPGVFKAIGGTEGVGVAFLEETFASPAANPKHRLHQKAIRAVLQALLPEAGTEIKGHMRSHAELLALSGYANRPAEFAELVRILDGDIRLLTPTDPQGCDEDTDLINLTPGQRYYQLTHDYLVPSLRTWLTRKQRETRRGRAELRLAERSALWNSRRERQLLPTLWEWLTIQLLTRERDWTPPQNKMMRIASRYYACLGGILALVLGLLLFGVREYHGRQRASALRDRLLSAATADVPPIVREIAPFRWWTDPLLKKSVIDAQATQNPSQLLRLSLALLPTDPDQTDYLGERLLDVAPGEFIVVRDALLPTSGRLTEKLWAQLEDSRGDPDRRFRAACALAAYNPEDDRWARYSDVVVLKLVNENPLSVVHWQEALVPVKKHLLPRLANALATGWREDATRRTVLAFYRNFAQGVPGVFDTLASFASAEDSAGGATLDQARRSANIGAALIALGQGDRVWSVLKRTDDLTVRSHLISAIAQLADPGPLVERLTREQNPSVRDREPEVSIRRAVLLALGSFKQNRLSEAERSKLVPLLVGLFENDPDPGIHSATEWVLRTWERKRELDLSQSKLMTAQPLGNRRWYLSKEGQTLALLPREMEFFGTEKPDRRKEKLGYELAVATKEITVDEFRKWKEHKWNTTLSPSGDCPVNSITLYEAAEFCNWLSERDGIPRSQWCYEPNAEGKFANGMRIAPDFKKRSGYRLPMETEWLAMASAGSKTGWACGEVDRELLAEYAWYHHNSYGNRVQATLPVGSLKPNDLGLFDLHGNLSEWTHDQQTFTAAGTDPFVISDRASLLSRGGALYQQSDGIRSDSVLPSLPAHRYKNTGFRFVRIFPSKPTD